MRPVDRLIGYARNARTHSDEQVAQIAASIAEFGWTNPVLVGSDGVVIAGHARLQAARKLGLKEVPVIVLDHLSEAQRRALIIADNRLAQNAGWDEDMLRVELQALQGDAFDLDLLGFEDEELDDLLKDPVEETEGQTEDDAGQEAREAAISKPGDVRLLGRHRLLCGDATEFSAYEMVLGGDLADLVFCDPPYNVAYTGGSKIDRTQNRQIENDALGDGFEEFLRDSLANILAASKGAIYVCMSSSEIDRLKRIFQACGGHWSTFIIWAKDRFTLGTADYQRQFEPILYGWREGGKHFWCGARNQGDVWPLKRLHKCDLHPTMKPVELVERAIENSSKNGDVVLDPFGGSGTTVIACEKTGRRGRAIELDARYCDVIVRRWQEFTGKRATLESTGAVFPEA